MWMYQLNNLRSFSARWCASQRTIRVVSGHASMATWTGHGQSQDDFMRKDMCIVVDDKDDVTHAASKMDCHRFDAATPTGHLHRAFSVFLFDQQNRLLIQQRALDKKTFPGVWTNTCCSHPLHGHMPDEVDDSNAVREGRVGGAVSAAIRKLEHELGIPASNLDRRSFVFLTRLLYCAADTDPSTGKPTGWGEHELDYILFARANVALDPNREEVSDTKFVTADDLRDMMRPETQLRWSPWFRIIADNFLYKWWEDLDGVLLGHHADWGTIHRLKC